MSRPLRATCLAVLLSGPIAAAAQAPGPEARFRAALAAAEAGRTTEAVETLEDLVASYPGFGPAHLHLGRLLLERGDAAAAASHLEAAVRRELPRPAIGWQWLGKARLAAGDPTRALAAFDHALGIAPGLAPARLGAAEALVALGRRGDAQARLAAVSDPSPDERALASRLAVEAGDLWTALAGYHALLEEVAPSPELLAATARVEVAMGLDDLAVCHAGAAVGVRPDPELHRLIAAAEEGRGDLDAAIGAVRRALDLAPGDARAWHQLGDLLFARLEIAGSIEAYAKAVRLDPEAAESIRPFALATLTAEDRATLHGLLARHADAHPENVDTLYALGQLAFRDGDLGRAERIFRKLAEAAPGHAQVHYNLGQILLRRGATEDGRAEMARFRELQAVEDATWERHNRAFFRRQAAAEAQERGDATEAAQLLEVNVAEGTADLDDHLALAELALEAGRLSEAHERFAGLVAANPWDLTAIEGTAATAEALGLDAEASAARGKLRLARRPCRALAPAE